MSLHLASEDLKITNGVTTAAGASGTGAIAGAALDMAGWDGVLIVVALGPMTTGGTCTIKAQQHDDDGFGVPEDIEGTLQTLNVDSDDNSVKYIDLMHPEQRYVRVYISRGAQASTIGSVLYIQYRGDKFPADQGTSVDGEAHLDPVGGTA